MNKKEKIVIVGILHNIRSAHNVGSMFRTADAVGMSHLYLTGYTPTPIDQYGRPMKEIAKTALGAESLVGWSHVPRLSTLLKKLHKEGYFIIALERHKRSHPYDTRHTHSPVAILVGNEVQGVSPGTLRSVDMIAEIPMHGKKESLNVSVAFGVGAYGIRRSFETN